MNRLLILTDAMPKARAIQDLLGSGFELQFTFPSQMKDTRPDNNLLVDIDLHNNTLLLHIREWLKLRSKPFRVIVILERESQIDNTLAAAIAPTDVIYRPIDRKSVLDVLLGDIDLVMLDASRLPIRKDPVGRLALDALDNIFTASRVGVAPDLRMIDEANHSVAEHVSKHGLEKWLDLVRMHHSRTYQHSLIAVGVAASFCQRLGFPVADQRRISLGAMLHDTGKILVPLSILEKPGVLDEDEKALVQKHPHHGIEALKAERDLHRDVLEIVLHHHEFLDGSGYPDRLHGNEICDPVRIVTICDIFSALIERRSYKESMSGEAALRVMQDMEDKLDRDLLREFHFVSQLRVAA